MDIEKRYAGRGNPVWHYHVDARDGKRSLDVLLFASGEYAVWSPDLEECISFWQTEGQATFEAKRLLGRKDP